MDDFKRFIYCMAAAVGLTITMGDEGMSNAAILKHFGLTPGGRNNQNLTVVLDVLADLEDSESED